MPETLPSQPDEPVSRWITFPLTAVAVATAAGAGAYGGEKALDLRDPTFYNRKDQLDAEITYTQENLGLLPYPAQQQRLEALTADRGNYTATEGLYVGGGAATAVLVSGCLALMFVMRKRWTQSVDQQKTAG